ncbi:MAG: response regulator [Bacteroidota bacterium]
MKNSGIIICRKDSITFFEQVGELFQEKPRFLSDDSEIHCFLNGKEIHQVYFCLLQSQLESPPVRHSGVHLIPRLRASGLRCPIYCISTRSMSSVNLDHSRSILFKISKFHQWVKLPKPASFWRNLNRGLMSNYMLQDIKQTMLTLRAIGQEYLHEFKNKLLTLEATTDKRIIEGFIRQYFADFQKFIPEKEKALFQLEQKLKRQLIDEWDNKDKVNLLQRFEACKTELLSLLPHQPTQQSLEKEILSTTKWKVLFMDDDEKVRTYMSNSFQRNHVQCIIVKNGEEAIEALDQYHAQKLITVFISDIRMLKANGEWQGYQGYDMLSKARNDYQYVQKLIAFTSGNSRLIKLMNDGRLLVKRILKQDVMSSEGATNLFVQQIREMGDECYFRSRNQPKGKTWDTNKSNRFGAPLGHYYREHLMAPDYLGAEKIINENAESFVEAVQNKKATKDYKFTGTIKNLPSSSDGLEHFREKILTGRRIALALHLHLEQDKKDIFQWMCPDTQVGSHTDKINNSANQLLSTTLALSLKKDIPIPADIKSKRFLNSHLLEEEIIWLINTYDINFDLQAIRLEKSQRDVMSFIIDHLQSFFRKSKRKNMDVTTLNHLLEFDHEKEMTYTYKKMKDFLNTAKQLAVTSETLKEMKRIIQEDVEDIKDPKLRKLFGEWL